MGACRHRHGDPAGYYGATDANGNYIGMAGFFYKDAVTQEFDPPGELGSRQPTFEPNGINKADWIVGPVQSPTARRLARIFGSADGLPI